MKTMEEKKKRRREENEQKKWLALGPMGKWSLDHELLDVNLDSGTCSLRFLLPAQQLIREFLMVLWINRDCL